MQFLRYGLGGSDTILPVAFRLTRSRQARSARGYASISPHNKGDARCRTRGVAHAVKRTSPVATG